MKIEIETDDLHINWLLLDMIKDKYPDGEPLTMSGDEVAGLLTTLMRCINILEIFRVEEYTKNATIEGNESKTIN